MSLDGNQLRAVRHTARQDWATMLDQHVMPLALEKGIAPPEMLATRQWNHVVDYICNHDPERIQEGVAKWPGHTRALLKRRRVVVGFTEQLCEQLGLDEPLAERLLELEDTAINGPWAGDSAADRAANAAARNYGVDSATAKGAGKKPGGTFGDWTAKAAQQAAQPFVKAAREEGGAYRFICRTSEAERTKRSIS